MNKIFLSLGLVITFGVIVGINGYNRPKTLVKERYPFTYSVCEKTYYGPKTSHCEKWKSAIEYRVDYEVDGLFFNYTSYRVVK